MSNLAGKPPLGLKGPKAKKDEARLERIRQMPCCVCQTFGEVQLSPTSAHHCIHDRFGSRKRSDAEAIPLCEGHHQGLFDTSKLALHQEPALWRDRYGPDWAFLSTLGALTKKR